MFPIIQDNTVVMRSSPTVQGRDRPIKLITGVGNEKYEGPKSPVKSLFQKAIYCSSNPFSKPYMSRNVLTISLTAAGSR